jgi:uncharacterized protein
LKFFLVLFVVAVGAWLLFGRGRRNGAAPVDKKSPPDAAAPAMVACAHCGVHLPPADAVREGGEAYCSDAHRLAGPRSS